MTITETMQVVRLAPDRAVTVLGWCARYDVRPGGFVTVNEPPPQPHVYRPPQPGEEPSTRVMRRGHFKAIVVADQWRRWTALEVTDASPPVEWLRGWMPATHG